MKTSKINFIFIILLLFLSFMPQINAAISRPLDEEISWEEFIQDLEELRRAFINDFNGFHLIFSPSWTTISWHDIHEKFPNIENFLPEINQIISKKPKYSYYFDALVPVFTNVRSSCYQIISKTYESSPSKSNDFLQTASLMPNQFMGRWGSIQFELTFINLAFSITYDLISEQILTDLILNKKIYSENYLQDTKIKPSQTFQEITKLTPDQLTQFCKIFGVIYEFLIEILIDHFNNPTSLSTATDDFFSNSDKNELWKKFIQEHFKLFVGEKDTKTETLHAGKMILDHFKPIYSKRILLLLNLVNSEIKDENKIKGHLKFGNDVSLEDISNDLSTQMLSDYLTVKWMSTSFSGEEINYENKDDYLSKNFSQKLISAFNKQIQDYKDTQEKGWYAESQKMSAIKFFYDLEFQKMLFRIHHPKIGCLSDILVKRKIGGTAYSDTKKKDEKMKYNLQPNLRQLRTSLIKLKDKIHQLQQKLETLKVHLQKRV